jgi:hypothetical protein
MVEQVEQSLAGLVSSEGRSFDLRYEVRTVSNRARARAAFDRVV